MEQVYYSSIFTEMEIMLTKVKQPEQYRIAGERYSKARLNKLRLYGPRAAHF